MCLLSSEGAPTNAFPRSTTTKATAQFIYDTLSAGWKPIIGEAAANQVAQGSGSYTTLVPGTNLRIISLNTVFWYKSNFWLYDSDTAQPDPNGFLSFLVAQLQAAEDAGERVWIIGHIPPGGRQDILLDQSNYFSQIINRYSNTIAAQFFGHSHTDEFMVGYSDYSKKSASTAIATALITPRSSNPIYKVYDIDPDTYEVMDIKVYRSNVESATFQTQPTWDLVYSARSLYGPFVPSLTPTSSLSPAFWHQLTEAFETNNEAWNLYRSHNNDGQVVAECDADCKKEKICDMRAFRAENLCSKAKIGLNFRRDMAGRDMVVEHDHEICAGVGLGHVLNAIGTQLTKEQLEALRSEMRKAITA
ncbi:Metallo-dependent phosphatase-like protein [Coprinopsis sp. MPI-PUGE-AT-0042]|nr:Metallo-dependent phosphatase-like protein [Coprinopsis sp. MPI-PUGE-AT-0042]